MKKLRKCVPLAAILLVMLVCCSCAGGPDPVRLASERSNWNLASRCANGWFNGLEHAPHDQQLVRQALEDWDRALQADEKLLGWGVGAGGGK